MDVPKLLLLLVYCEDLVQAFLVINLWHLMKSFSIRALLTNNQQQTEQKKNTEKGSFTKLWSLPLN